MKKFWILSIVLIFSLGSAVLYSSCGGPRTIVVEEGWDLLGEAKVNFIRDRDEIDVNSDTRYTALVFQVKEREIRLNELAIHFPNGDKLEPNLDDVVQADQYSRVIDIDREGRVIDKVSFRYRTTGNILEGRATVLVLGKRAELF